MPQASAMAVRLLVSILVAVITVCGHAPAVGAVDYEKHVLPILREHCIDCHGPDEQRGKLQLDSVLGILRGGDSGEPLIVPGKPAESHLISRVAAANPKEVMPPEGERLTAEQIALLRAWISGGAAMPGEAEARAALRPSTTHWSFLPVRRRSGENIDQFIAAKLGEQGLSRSPAADKATLIRRLHLVLHGLPPTPEETRAFESDTRADAYARLVDAALASPRFGERWARHWMDVVRYADSNGFETNRERKNAYHYRDWLVEAFNADKPYDAFIREQIAGDALGADAATGFLVAGPYDIVKSPDINLTLAQRQDELADMVNTTGATFLGITIGCARCHNHKFDPVSQKDYYAIQAVFAGVRHGERPLRMERNAAAEDALVRARAEEAELAARLEAFGKQARAAGSPGGRPPVNPKWNEETFAAIEAAAVRFTISATSGAEPCLDELEIYDAAGKNVALGGKPSASGTLPGHAIHKLEHLNDGKVGNEWSWISDTPGRGRVQIDFPQRTRISRIVWSRARDGKYADRVPTQYLIEVASEPGKWTAVVGSDDREPVGGRVDPQALLARLSPADALAARRIEADLAAVRARIARGSGGQNAWVGTFSQPPPTHRLYRGEPQQQRELVAPDALAVLGTLGLAADAPEQMRRVKLAEWIAAPENPLTARVMVNRLWQYTFGTGLVETPSDFGVNGAPPTHPELLDWLADDFVRGGWSVKRLLRLMLLSETFQQSSAARPDAARIDAGGRFLWRYAPRRLEAEAIRDSILAVSGALDLRMGGPGFYLMDVVEENVMHYFAKESFTPAEFRRMVYQFRIRQTTDSVFSSFDCPDGGSVTPKRSRSNTPLQALNLFNSSFMVQQSEILAARLKADAGEAPAAQVERAFRLCYARPPDAAETEACVALIREHGLLSFARAMLNTSEFLFIF